MQPSARRAAAVALVGTLSLASPAVGALAAVPFALIAVIGRSVSSGPIFDLFARPVDREAGELRGLVGFSLAATGLALLAALTGLPAEVFIATVLVLVYGQLATHVAGGWRDEPPFRTLAFAGGGGLAAFGGLLAIAAVTGAPTGVATAAFLAVIGAVIAALLRAVFVDPEDPVVTVSVAVALWVFAELPVPVSALDLALAVVVAGSVGYASWATGTASVTGMLTGVFIALVTIVLGGYSWFAVLIAFFGLGGLAAKFRYEEKAAYGVAEPNEGARGGHNVLGNAAVALVAVVGFAASARLAIEPAVFLFAFAGSLSTALSDTLSSEIGVLFGNPRLITTFDLVEPGTNGGVTLGGFLAGVAGAAVVAGLAVGLLSVGPTGAAIITVAGVVGMTVDSLLGATLEGRVVGNQTVNFLATLAGAVVGVVGVALLGAPA